MKILLLAFIILSACIVLEAYHKLELPHDLGEEVVSRVTRGAHGKNKACKYEKGEWSTCEISTNTRMRTDTLKLQSDASCQPTRTISKKCKKICKYNNQSSWSECDPTTGKKSKVLLLKSGDPQACEPNKKITKSCQKSSGVGNRKNSKNK